MLYNSCTLKDLKVSHGSKELWNLAWKLNKKRKELLRKNITNFTSKELIEYGRKYDKIVQRGIKQNEEIPSKYLRDKEKAVLNRLIKYKKNYLNFLKDNDAIKFNLLFLSLRLTSN